jgi:hypothetical protein
MVGAVLERSDRCDFGTVSARGGLEVGRRIAIQIPDDPFINVEIVIRLSGASVHPGKGNFNCRVAIGSGIACGKTYR